jgi:hypothetical protein
MSPAWFVNVSRVDEQRLQGIALILRAIVAPDVW